MDRNLYPSSFKGVRELIADSDLGPGKVVGRHTEPVDLTESREGKQIHACGIFSYG